jgi:hypothetical protein
VGPAFGDAASGNVEAFLSSGNNVVGEQLNDSLISGNCGPTILFPPNDGIVAHVSADCTGTPYLVYRFLRHLGPVTYAVTGPAVSLMYNSVRDNSTIGCPCVTLTGGPTDLFPSVAVDTSGFTPPFRIELR